MSQARHVILNHVDTPLRILFWTTGELGLYISPTFLGLILDQFCLGVLATIFNIWAYRKYNRRFGKGQFNAVRYWFLPHDKRNFKGIPPSYIREYLG